MGADHSLDKIVFFDGVCNLCNASVQFLIRHNKKNSIRFASLQSEFAKNALSPYQTPNDLDSILYLKGNKIYVKSDAILNLLPELNNFYSLFTFLKFIPRPIRDFVYDFVAKRRYQWFGKRNECWLPTPELKERFIA
jgi:predicted DCC family thiol-disulfide oxidoreductase YuxK